MLKLFTILSVLSVYVKGIALPLNEKRDDPTPLKLDFSVDRSIDLTDNPTRISKREIYPQELTLVGGVSYVVDIFLGSNQQVSKLRVETGSSDT